MRTLCGHPDADRRVEFTDAKGRVCEECFGKLTGEEGEFLKVPMTLMDFLLMVGGRFVVVEVDDGVVYTAEVTENFADAIDSAVERAGMAGIGKWEAREELLNNFTCSRRYYSCWVLRESGKLQDRSRS